MKKELLTPELLPDLETKTNAPAKKLDDKAVVQAMAEILKPVIKILDQRNLEAGSLKIKTEAELTTIRNQLSQDKSDYKLIEATIKKITRPAFDFKKSIDAELKKIATKFDTLNFTLETKILEFADKHEAKTGHEVEIKGVRVTKTIKIKSVDWKKINPKYLLLNESLVRLDALAGTEIKGLDYEIVEEKGLAG